MHLIRTCRRLRLPSKAIEQSSLPSKRAETCVLPLLETPSRSRSFPVKVTQGPLAPRAAVRHATNLDVVDVGIDGLRPHTEWRRAIIGMHSLLGATLNQARSRRVFRKDEWKGSDMLKIMSACTFHGLPDGILGNNSQVPN